ncbi:hypothetical protein ACQUY5_29335 [Bacillus cereus]|uniref:hypothetical protein n=1 Tax=Bacillus cereus TaxID=1396 RepID=UPI003D16F21D
MENKRPVVFKKDGLVALGYLEGVEGETSHVEVLYPYSDEKVVIQVPSKATIEIDMGKRYELDIKQQRGYMTLGQFFRSTEIGSGKLLEQREVKDYTTVKEMTGQDVYYNLFVLCEQTLLLEREQDKEYAKQVYKEVGKLRNGK